MRIDSFIRKEIFVGVGCLVAGVAMGQSFNIEFNNGTAGVVPSSSYGAAGQAGLWNPFNMGLYSANGSLLNLDGSASAVSMMASWGGSFNTAGGPWSGDTRYLLQDSITSISDSGIRFTGLESGLYTIIVYTSNTAGSFRVGGQDLIATGGVASTLVNGLNYAVLSDYDLQGDTLTIFANNRTTGLAGLQLIHNATPVPEPTTLSILGLAALFGARKVRRQRSGG